MARTSSLSVVLGQGNGMPVWPRHAVFWIVHADLNKGVILMSAVTGKSSRNGPTAPSVSTLGMASELMMNR
jgi:hypothetical protein